MHSSSRHPARHRATTAAAFAATALALAGCADTHSASTAAKAPATPALTSSGTGWVTVTAPPGQPDAPALRIRAAALYPGAPGGGEELRMTVTNDSAATEHLYGITSTHTSGSELFNAPATAGAQPQPADAAGITLQPGATTTFGPGGPRILLTGPIGLASGRPVALTLDFALAGLVRLTAVPSTEPSTSSVGAGG